MNKVVLFALLFVVFVATDQYFRTGENAPEEYAYQSASGQNVPSLSRQGGAQLSSASEYNSQHNSLNADVSDDPTFCSADTLNCTFETAPEPMAVGEYVAVDDFTNWQVDAEPMSVGDYISMEELTISDSSEEMIVGEFYDVNDYLNESKEPMSVGEELDIDEWISQREYSQD